MKNKIFVFAILFFTVFSINAKAQSGAIDSTFNPGTGANNGIKTSALQSDGKIIIGGSFYSFNETSRNNIARVNADGTLDATFDPGTGASSFVETVALQSDGKILIGGYFTSYNGTSRNYIARLNADGTLDTAFDPGAGANNSVHTIAIQSDGKIIIGGDFLLYNGTQRSCIARLNADGTLDATFDPGTGANNGAHNCVEATALQSDGKIIIGGDFTTYNGINRKRVARLNTDGALDVTFNSGTVVSNSSVFAIALQNDGKIIIGGDFTSGTSNSFIARLNTDGALDTTFNYGGGCIMTITLQSDGKVFIGGAFPSYNGIPINHFARLNTDGTLDVTFNTGIGPNSAVLTAALQSDGKIIICGGFTDYNGNARKRIARILNPDVGISHAQANAAISIYPNPVSNELNIEIEGNKEPVNFEILNSTGQVVFKGNLVEKTTVQTNHWAAGVYLIKLGNEKVFEFKKVIKE
ncbi:MAG: T9SS type A sorting domain-containing protein [Bacteroidota bacterium]